MSLLFCSARLMASLSDNAIVLSLVTPRRVRFGSGGSGLCSIVGNKGVGGSSVAEPSGTGVGSADGDCCGTVVTPGTMGWAPGTVVGGTAGGGCGAGCCVAGGAVGFWVSGPGGVAALGVGLADGTCAQLATAVAAIKSAQHSSLLT